MSGRSSSSLALAAYVLDRVEGVRLPPAVIARGVDRVTDALAVSLSAVSHPASIAARSIAQPLGDAHGATIIGSGNSYSAVEAALANGTTAHCSLQEDLGPGGHPSTFVIPAALAAAELSAASGRDFLRAVIAGYEVVGRIAESTPDGLRQRGFRTLPTLGVFGAAAAAAVALGLDARGVAAALDLAANQAGGLYQGFVAGSAEGFLHAGFAARAGVTSAQLAAVDVPTAGDTLGGRYGFFATYTGEQTPRAPLVPDVAPTDYVIDAVCSKPFPACAQNQGSMSSIAADSRLPLDPALIRSVVIERPTSGRNGLHPPGVDAAPPFSSALQAQMSAVFTTCAALLGRPVTNLSYFTEAFSDPGVVALCARTELRAHADARARISVHLEDGSTIVVQTSPGTESWSTEGAGERFVRLAWPRLTPENGTLATARLQQLWSLPSIRDLTGVLRAP